MDHATRAFNIEHDLAPPRSRVGGARPACAHDQHRIRKPLTSPQNHFEAGGLRAPWSGASFSTSLRHASSCVSQVCRGENSPTLRTRRKATRRGRQCHVENPIRRGEHTPQGLGKVHVVARRRHRRSALLPMAPPSCVFSRTAPPSLLTDQQHMAAPWPAFCRSRARNRWPVRLCHVGNSTGPRTALLSSAVPHACPSVRQVRH